MLIHCKECGKELSDEVKICPNCGFHVGTKKVKKRGKPQNSRRTKEKKT